MTGEVTLNQFIIALLETAYRSLKQATDDLTDEQLYYQPTAESNSMAWLVWMTLTGMTVIPGALTVKCASSRQVVESGSHG